MKRAILSLCLILIPGVAFSADAQLKDLTEQVGAPSSADLFYMTSTANADASRKVTFSNIVSGITSITGNAGTATALSANGTNCSAGSYALGVDASGNAEGCTAATGGGGTVTSVSVATANGVSGSVANATTTPAITLSLGSITPSSLTVSGASTLTGNVGIGTSSPRSKLDIAGDMNVDGAIYLGSNAGGYVDLNNNAVARFYEATANGSNHVDLIAPASLSANTTYTLPSSDGTSGQAMVTNGAGVLSWATAGGGAGTSISVGNTNATVADTGTDGNLTITTEGTQRMVIGSDGKVGIGMATGTSDVKIQGTSVINNSNGGGGALAVCKAGSTSNCLRFSVQDNTSGNNMGTIQGAIEGASYNNLAINPIGGDVMIGAADGSAPRGKLDVKGSLAANGGSTNKAVCWKSTGVLGYCSATVDSSGACGTCN